MFNHLLKPQVYGDGVLVYLAIAGTHCACLQRDGQAELTYSWLHTDMVY